MPTELILLEDVNHLGEMGEVVRVNDGYARNYLVPRGLATKASAGALRQLEVKKERVAEERAARAASAREQAKAIDGISLTIPMQATDESKLYGSVTAQHIVDALAEMNVNIERHQVILDEPIRELGEYDVQIQLHPEAKATVRLWVVKA